MENCDCKPYVYNKKKNLLRYPATPIFHLHRIPLKGMFSTCYLNTKGIPSKQVSTSTSAKHLFPYVCLRAASRSALSATETPTKKHINSEVKSPTTVIMIGSAILHGSYITAHPKTQQCNDFFLEK